MRDERGRFVQATATTRAKEQFSIDEAARQLASDSAQRDLAESSTELAKTASVTPGGFPESPHKGSQAKPQRRHRQTIQIAQAVAIQTTCQTMGKELANQYL